MLVVYSSKRKEDIRIIHDEFEPDDNTVKDSEVIKIAKELIEKYTYETPNYLDKAVS
jgi:hypothetical protein